MEAAQIPKAGADFQIVEREIPNPPAGQVRIKVKGGRGLRTHDERQSTIPRGSDDVKVADNALEKPIEHRLTSPLSRAK